jgi:hypothetical protein
MTLRWTHPFTRRASVDTKRTKGVVDGDQHCWRRTFRGWLANQDTWVGEGGSAPQTLA